MVAPVTARLVPAFGARASPYHPTSSACPNFCAAGTTDRWSCVQSATVGKDSSEPLFAVHSIPTVRNRCACFLHDASSRMCLPAGLIHGKEGYMLCSFPSQVLSGAQQTVGADAKKKSAARNLRQRKYNVFLILCPWRAKGPTPPNALLASIPAVTAPVGAVRTMCPNAGWLTPAQAQPYIADARLSRLRIRRSELRRLPAREMGTSRTRGLRTVRIET